MPIRMSLEIELRLVSLGADLSVRKNSLSARPVAQWITTHLHQEHTKEDLADSNQQLVVDRYDL